MADNNYDDLYNSDVIDTEGNKIGGVGQVYLDDKTGLPTWVTVKTGLFGTKETFVPLDVATLTENQIQVPYTEDFVKKAPSIDPDRHLDADEEAQLYQYYGVAVVAEQGQTQLGEARRSVAVVDATPRAEDDMIVEPDPELAPARAADDVETDLVVEQAMAASADVDARPDADLAAAAGVETGRATDAVAAELDAGADATQAAIPDVEIDRVGTVSHAEPAQVSAELPDPVGVDPDGVDPDGVDPDFDPQPDETAVDVHGRNLGDKIRDAWRHATDGDGDIKH